MCKWCKCKEMDTQGILFSSWCTHFKPLWVKNWCNCQSEIFVPSRFSPQGFGVWLPGDTAHPPYRWGPTEGPAPCCSAPGTASERCHSDGWAGLAAMDLLTWSYTSCIQNIMVLNVRVKGKCDICDMRVWLPRPSSAPHKVFHGFVAMKRPERGRSVRKMATLFSFFFISWEIIVTYTGKSAAYCQPSLSVPPGTL